MEKELNSLEDNDVWDRVDLPKDRKAIGSKWVFKHKSRLRIHAKERDRL